MPPRPGSLSSSTHGLERQVPLVTDERPSWDETWMAVAHVVARRSRCVRDQVGAVIVDPSNRVVATAYNGPPASHIGVGSCDAFCERGAHGPTTCTARSYTDCVSLHAEANGLMVCDRTTRLDGVIYVTSHVCWGCAKLIANSGLSGVVVPYGDGDASYRQASESYDFLESCGIEVIYV